MGKPVHEMSADQAADFRNRHIGVILRNPGFMEHLTLIENVALPLALRGVTTFQRNKAAKERLVSLGLDYATHAHPSQLSAYERKLATLARVLIAEPELLLLDDIAAGLSEKDAGKFGELFNKTVLSGNFSVICFCTERCQNFAADKRYRLEYGKLQEDLL
jgi:putative ABC transport system ATP-binding protein